MTFVEQIAPLVQKYAPVYGINVCSPIIAQAILESAQGTSELAINACNYFGLKYTPNRCKTCIGIYSKIGSEQDSRGYYTSSVMQWMKFLDMEGGVIGYFDFINTSRYSNLKGVTDPETYLKNIKADGYATSLKYVDNLMAVIAKYNLTQYDTVKTDKKGDDKLIINVHAGHNPDGKKACGAVGLIKESTQARLVKNKVISLLRAEGHTVYDCTCEDGSSVNNVLSRIVDKANEHKVDIDISIHFNAGRNDYVGDGKIGGTEVFIHDSSSKALPYAQRVVKSIASLGFTNRGVKYSSSLYVLRKTNSPAMLIECCFVDDADDVLLYDMDKMADAIVSGIVDKKISSTSTNTNKKDLKCPFKVKVLDDELNIRAGAGIEFDVVGVITNHGTYTIVETNGNWGKLKSGAGWISINTKYVKYV